MKIGVIAPSFSMSVIDKRLIEIGKANLKKLGYDVVFAKNVLNTDCGKVAALKERLDDIEEFLYDDSVDIVMSAIGGSSSHELLKYLDFDEIKTRKKKIIGFSDTASLLNGIYAKTNLPTYHGPSFVSFCNPSLYDGTVKYFRLCISDEDEKDVLYYPPRMCASDDWYKLDGFGPRKEYLFEGWKYLKKGMAKGILVGGNLDTFINNIEPEYMPDFEQNDKILMIEDTVDTSFDQFKWRFLELQQRGILKKISGLIIGHFGHNINSLSKMQIEEFVIQNTGEYPVLYGMPFSHIDPIYTTKIGGKLYMDSNNDIIKMLGDKNV